MKGYKSYRHEQNPKEKEFHDNFLKEHNRKGYEDMDLIVFGHGSESLKPNDYLNEREKKIVLSTIRWLGSPVGQGFLKECGFEAAIKHLSKEDKLGSYIVSKNCADCKYSDVRMGADPCMDCHRWNKFKSKV